MKYLEAKRDFEIIYIHLYLNKVDYWKAQEAWASFIDGLCKDGKITQKQYDTWQTPFPYGKDLKPSYRQLCWANDVKGLG